MTLVCCSDRTSPPVTLMSNLMQLSWIIASHVFVVPFMLMSVDFIKLTPCPYSSCDARMEARRANPRSNGVLIGVWRSWSSRAKFQIPQFGFLNNPQWDSGIWRRLWLIFDDACNLWRVGTRAALCSWCIWRGSFVVGPGQRWCWAECIKWWLCIDAWDCHFGTYVILPKLKHTRYLNILHRLHTTSVASFWWKRTWIKY